MVLITNLTNLYSQPALEIGRWGVKKRALVGTDPLLGIGTEPSVERALLKFRRKVEEKRRGESCVPNLIMLCPPRTQRPSSSTALKQHSLDNSNTQLSM